MKSPEEAIRIQEELRSKIITDYQGPPYDRIRYVAGCDVSYIPEKDMMIGLAVLLAYPSLMELAMAYSVKKVDFPYIPGLLSFREAPVLLDAFSKLPRKPDVVFVDGQGIAHPRGIGLASHFGLVADVVSIGVAKSRLVGSYNEEELGVTKGSYVPLIFEGKVVGFVLRTKDNTNPVFVSPGHKVDLDTSLYLTLKVTRNYRIPEPTRIAHIKVSQVKKNFT